MDFQENGIEWLVQLITDLLISLPELWPLLLTANVSPVCLQASSSDIAVPWNKLPSVELPLTTVGAFALSLTADI